MAPITFDPQREQAELAEYLGDRYDHTRLLLWEQALEEEAAEIGDEPTLYRSSQMYLYNLTAFAMTRTKEPYLRVLTEVVPPGARVLDYGCGIGSDGLLLLEAGYDVSFADFANPSVDYLRWRLAKRGLEAPIYDLDRQTPPAGSDLVYAFDVIEHVDDPFAFLDSLESVGELVAVNFLRTSAQDVTVHRKLPLRALLDRAASRNLERYHHFHGRSHFVVYAGVRGSRARGWARIAKGALRGTSSAK